MARRLAALLTFVTLVGCAHLAAIDEMPPAFRQRLARQPVWLTIARYDNRPGDFPPSETAVVKRWEVDEEEGVAVRLREVATSSFVGIIERLRADEPTRAEVELDGRIDPEDFFAHPDQVAALPVAEGAQRYAFKAIDARRFQIEVNGGLARILFMPAPNDYQGASDPLDGRDVGVWTTPFGPEGELFSYVRRRLGAGEARAPELGPSVFLHHDLTVARPIEVTIDRGFPAVYDAAVDAAIARWNEALGKALYRRAKERAPLDPAACLTGFRLCLQWVGPPDVPATGASAYTELGFDPLTGLITGAIISVVNDDATDSLVDAPEDERRRFAADTLGASDDAWQWAARTVASYGRWSGYRHPAPLAYVEHVVVHEMGHANGFGHNFYAAGRTTLDEPAHTVMAYPPFPVAHRLRALGPFDRDRLALVYGRPVDTEALRYCSTLDALAPERVGPYLRKRADCEIFTVGDPAAWFMRLAQVGDQGVFTAYPDMSHLSEDLKAVYRELNRRRGMPPLNLLSRLGFVLADTDAGNAPRRAAVRTFLCSLGAQRTAIEAQLREFQGVELACENH